MCLKTSNILMKYLLIICFFLFISLSHASSIISANLSLSGNQTIVSKRENFALGFFKAGNSSNYYVGIWYNKVSTTPPTVVWVANRESPIFDIFNSELKILHGNLVLLNESKHQIWSTNVTTNSNSAAAVLQDDGNLVLTDGSNTVDPVWQSFDNPVHTWLPGAKLVYNHKKKKAQRLTSWRSHEDPGVGMFSLEPVPSGNEYISLWNGSQQYWTSGPWNGHIFSSVPEMRLNYIYNFSFVSKENESYFTYSVYDPNIISRFVMDVSGQIQQLSWLDNSKQWNLFWAQPRTQCETYAYCGAFGTCRLTELPFCSCVPGFKPKSENDWNQDVFNSGCVRITNIECGSSNVTLDFFMLKVKSLPLNSSVVVGGGGECRTSCLRDCSCNAYSFVDNKCSVWYGDILNLSEDVNGNAIFVKVSSKDLPRRIHKVKNEVKMGVVVGSVSGVVLIVGLFLLIIYKKNRIFVTKTKMEGLLVSFVYRDLQIATKNFTEKLGGGGFGSVFKGVLRDSSVVAVKKLESVSQGDKQFRSEVSTIGTIQHVNLVRLRGFCAQGSDKLLVYDYMPNGSLSSHIFNENPLNWKTRYEIALGVARGLVYLHEKCRDCIIHCDIKPENILLDADFCPKIADFGLAKLVGRDFSRVLTTMRGTRGYLAPEWLSGVAVTPKADVYSYGMMLFELVYGKRNAEQSENVSTFFPSLVTKVLMVGGDILSVLDSRLKNEASVEEVTKICKVACWCIQDEEDSRPSMSMVEQILEGVLDVNMPPIPHSVMLFLDNTEDIVFFTESSSNGSSENVSNGDP
ncbi:G-type lectin S-receptor-like serine/threonine-protein kinase At2g19130 [Rutidosis leptorrhynchoides]|uniref:G-type lectin S-receptor-like serine/threonine-protein kinase At2g19130 n=1 Tax=Rutidosis leptorrhynchoides TaxID=125765 RepID=UPI003A993DBF